MVDSLTIENVAHVLACSVFELLLNQLSLLVTLRHVQSSERRLNDPRDKLARLRLRCFGRVLDGAFGGCIADVHSVACIFVTGHVVDNHVNHEVSALRIAGHFDVRLDAGERSRIVVGDLLDLGEQFGFAPLSHFPVPDRQAELLLVRVHGMLLRHPAIILHAVLHRHRRLFHSRLLAGSFGLNGSLFGVR